jgi:hypothetical protein
MVGKENSSPVISVGVSVAVGGIPSCADTECDMTVISRNRINTIVTAIHLKIIRCDFIKFLQNIFFDDFSIISFI